MRIGIIGSESLSHNKIKEWASAYAHKMRKKYPTSLTFVTLRDDALGKRVRIVSRKLNIRRFTVSSESHVGPDAAALTVGQLMWHVTHLVVLDDGDSPTAKHAIEIARRMSKPLRIVLVDDM